MWRCPEIGLPICWLDSSPNLQIYLYNAHTVCAHGKYETSYVQQFRGEPQIVFEDQQAGVMLCLHACAPARIARSILIAKAIAFDLTI